MSGPRTFADLRIAVQHVHEAILASPADGGRRLLADEAVQVKCAELALLACDLELPGPRLRAALRSLPQVEARISYGVFFSEGWSAHATLRGTRGEPPAWAKSVDWVSAFLRSRAPEEERAECGATHMREAVKAGALSKVAESRIRFMQTMGERDGNRAQGGSFIAFADGWKAFEQAQAAAS